MIPTATDHNSRSRSQLKAFPTDWDKYIRLWEKRVVTHYNYTTCVSFISLHSVRFAPPGGCLRWVRVPSPDRTYGCFRPGGCHGQGRIRAVVGLAWHRQLCRTPWSRCGSVRFLNVFFTAVFELYTLITCEYTIFVSFWHLRTSFAVSLVFKLGEDMDYRARKVLSICLGE